MLFHSSGINQYSWLSPSAGFCSQTIGGVGFVINHCTLANYQEWGQHAAAGWIQLVGARLLPEAEQNRQRILGCLTPFVGWFGLLVYLCLQGLGAFILSNFRRPKPFELGAE